MNISSWSGYAFDVPGGPSADSRYPGAELDLRRLLYARALSQLEKRPEDPLMGYAMDRSALWDSRHCGRGSGLHRICEGLQHGRLS